MSTDRRLRVVIADDHFLVREGVRRALDADLDVVAAVEDSISLVRAVDAELPDAVVTDIRMPPGGNTDGIMAAHRIRSSHPDIGVVVLSQYNDAEYAIELLRDGTSGLAYLLKERVGDPDSLVAAVRAVANGGSRVDPDIVAALVSRADHPDSPLSDLNEREHDVIAHMAEGRTNAGIAEQLHLSESSVEKYATSVFAKLGITDELHTHRRVSAVLAFLKQQREGE